MISMLFLNTVILFSVIIKVADGRVISRECLLKNATINERQVGDLLFPPVDKNNCSGENNNHWQRPIRDALKPIDISFRIVLSSINDVIEKIGIVKLNGYLILSWIDEFKIWNNTFPYSCVDYVTVPANLLWLPDVAVTNSENHYDLLLSKDVERARLFSNGTVSYRPGGTFMLYCEFNVKWFPFDTSVCPLVMEGWRVTATGQTFSLNSPSFSRKYWRENEHWRFISGNMSVDTAVYITGDTFPRVTFTLTMSRKAGYYMANVIVPSVIISVAQLSVFSLPVDEVLKIHICFTCLLAYGVFQLMIIEDMPRTSDNIPLLSYYIDLSMAFIAAIMIGEGAVFLSLKRSEEKMPRKMPRLLLQFAKLASIPLFISREKRRNLLLTRTKSEPAMALAQLHRRYQSFALPSITENLEPGQFSSPHPNDSNENRRRRKVSAWNVLQDVFINNGKRQSLPNMIITNNTDKVQQGDHHSDNDDDENGKLLSREWQFLAQVLDKVTFYTYLALIIGTPIIMFGILPKFSD